MPVQESIQFKLKLDPGDLQAIRSVGGGGGGGGGGFGTMGIGGIAGGAALGTAGALVALQGIKMGMDKLVQSSPQLQGSLLMLQKSVELGLRPIGDAIGLAIRPMAVKLLTEMSKPGGIYGPLDSFIKKINEKSDADRKSLENFWDSIINKIKPQQPPNVTVNIPPPVVGGYNPQTGNYDPYPTTGYGAGPTRATLVAREGGRMTAGGGVIFAGKTHAETVEAVNRLKGGNPDKFI